MTNQDYKTQFQEWVQAKGSVKIEYRLLDQTGPAHDRCFTSGLFLNGQQIAQGSGKSKKQAEMHAAKQALDQKNKGE